MIANSFFSLLILSIGSFFLPKEKYSRFFSGSLFVLGAILFFEALRGWLGAENSLLTWNWIEIKNRHIQFDLSSDSLTYLKLVPAACVWIFCLFQNLFTPYEDRRLRLSGLMCLNMAFTILLFNAGDLFVFLVSSFLITISGLYLNNDNESKKDYIFYALISDMCLFLACAVIYSEVELFDLKSLSLYAEKGESALFVALLLLFSVFIKVGMFLFHLPFFKLTDLTFSRQLFMSFANLPLVGICIYEQFFPLLSNFALTQVLLLCFCLFTFAYGSIGSVVYEDIREKLICFNMIFWSFVLGSSFQAQTFDFEMYNGLFIIFFALNALTGSLISAASNESFVTKMGGFLKPLWFHFILYIIWFVVFSAWVYKKQDLNNPALSLFLFILVLFSLGSFLKKVFLGETRADDMVWALLKNTNVWAWLPSVLILGFGISRLLTSPQQDAWLVLGAISLILLSLFKNPFFALEKYNEDEDLQTSEFCSDFYDWIIVTPINVIGKILWLLIDFLIIEKTFLTSISDTVKFLINISQKIHKVSIMAYILLSLLGLGIVWVSVWR